jgi:hypothetical protein
MEQTDRNAKIQAVKILKTWDKNTPIATLELLSLIKNYKNFNSILLLILQVVDKELIKWRIDNMYMGLYELIVTMLVNHFITEWFDCHNCKIQAIESYHELNIHFDFNEVPFLIWFLESNSKDKEYSSDQPMDILYDFKNYFCKVLNKKLEENPGIQEIVKIFKNSEDNLLYNMAKDIAIREHMFSNDNLSRIQYSPNMFVRNLVMFSWFYKMFVRAQQTSSHTVKNGSKLNSSILNRIPSEIIDYMIKKYFIYNL